MLKDSNEEDGAEVSVEAIYLGVLAWVKRHPKLVNQSLQAVFSASDAGADLQRMVVLLEGKGITVPKESTVGSLETLATNYGVSIAV